MHQWGNICQDEGASILELYLPSSESHCKVAGIEASM
jgi:hypothetical protein